MAQTLPNGRNQFFDGNGDPLVGGLLWTFNPGPGVTTPKTTYFDADATTPHTNPIVLDARGEATIFWSGGYNIRLEDALGGLIYTVEDINTDPSAADYDALLRADLASQVDVTKGAGMSGFDWNLNYAANTVGWGIRTAQGLPNALRYMPVAEWVNILNGTTNTDLTTYIQQAVDAGPCYFPRGKWPFSATTGIKFKDGTHIAGAGKNRTIFWAILGTGGSAAQLAAYTAGSAFSRAFNPAIAQSYLGGVYLHDFAVILNHPTGSITATAKQIGIDLRNVSRWNVERVHVGNYAPVSSYVAKVDPPSGYAQQGYCFVIGNVSSGSISYCGGEVGTLRECSGWGAYKACVQDDLTLSPGSAAHAVQVLQCDFQGAHHLLVQETQYATGITWGDNTVQYAIKQNGDASSSYILHFSGYSSRCYGGYIEAGGGADYLLKLDSGSKANVFELAYYSATNAAQIVDLANGNRNIIRYRKDTGTIVGGVDSLGAPVELYDSSIPQPQWMGNWNGAAMVNDYTDSLTVTRNGVGDYNLQLSPVQKNATWVVHISGDANASGHPFVCAFSFGTQTTATMRFFTYGQNAGATTQLDPRKMWIRVSQSRT